MEISLTWSKTVTCSSSLLWRSKACSTFHDCAVLPVPKPVPLAQYRWDLSSDFPLPSLPTADAFVAAMTSCLQKLIVLIKKIIVAYFIQIHNYKSIPNYCEYK